MRSRTTKPDLAKYDPTKAKYKLGLSPSDQLSDSSYSPSLMMLGLFDPDPEKRLISSTILSSQIGPKIRSDMDGLFSDACIALKNEDVLKIKISILDFLFKISTMGACVEPFEGVSEKLFSDPDKRVVATSIRIINNALLNRQNVESYIGAIYSKYCSSRKGEVKDAAFNCLTCFVALGSSQAQRVRSLTNDSKKRDIVLLRNICDKELSPKNVELP